MDMTPEIIELSDGSVGYFYTPQQIDYWRMKQLLDYYAARSRYARDNESKETTQWLKLP